MAYIIGNTTVIDNNGALGAVDGNNLSLGSNSNIVAGGVNNATLYTSSTNVANTSGAMYIAVGGGGGAGGRDSGQQGGRGGTGVGGVSDGPVTITVGTQGFGQTTGRGNRGNPSSIATPSLTANVFGGSSGGGVTFQPGQGAGPGVGFSSWGPGSVLMDSNTLYGAGGIKPPPPANTGNPGTQGAVKVVFF